LDIILRLKREYLEFFVWLEGNFGYSRIDSMVGLKAGDEKQEFGEL
jgi:hypothetical protein